MEVERVTLQQHITTLLCYFIKMIIKNPNKNNELKVLVETLKEKNIITDADLINAKTTLKKKTKK